jgi:hypothetical protein
LSEQHHTCITPTGNYKDLGAAFKKRAKLMGLSLESLVALSARMRSAQLQMTRLGVNETWTSDPSVLSANYFQVRM